MARRLGCRPSLLDRVQPGFGLGDEIHQGLGGACVRGAAEQVAVAPQFAAQLVDFGFHAGKLEASSALSP